MSDLARLPASRTMGARPSAGLKSAASGAIAAQSLNALGSLVVQIIAARSLGALGFGAYSLLYSVLISLTALYTGWVGDALTVLDRLSTRVRAGLVASIAGWLGIAAAVGATSAVAIGAGGPGLSTAGEWLIFPVLVMLWLVEETGRRIFMARREFWSLTWNDLVYNAVMLGALLAVHLTTHHLTLPRFLMCMAAGSAAAILALGLALPRDERRLLAPNVDGFREVAGFGAWRSMQVAIRPLSLLALRALIAGLYGEGVLSSVQAALLLLAPAQTLINGAGSFLLPLYSNSTDGEPHARGTDPTTAAALLAGATAVWSVAAIALVGRLSGPLTGGNFMISRSAVIGWSLFVLASAITIPGASLLVARRQTRSVFVVRLIAAVIGLGLAAIVCPTRSAQWAPYALAAGAAVGAALTIRLVHQVPTSTSATASFTELPPLPEPSARLDSLTGMRFLAALLVVVHHSVANHVVVSTHLVTLPFLRPVATVGYLGVTFFFVLSGFVLTYSWHPASSPRGFYGRRIARIVPMYLVAWAGAFLVFWQVGRHTTLVATLACLFLVQAWSTSSAVAFGQNAVAWSLSCEAFFYAVFPVFLARLSRLSKRGVVRALGVSCAGLVVAPAVAFKAFGGRPAVQYLHYLPAYRLGEFVVGICLALLVRRGWRPRLRLGPTSVAVAVWFLAVVALNSNAHAFISSAAPSGMPQVLAGVLILPAMALWIVAAAVTDLDDRPSFLRSPVLVRLGTWSYSLYLTHYLLLISLASLLSGHLPSGEASSILFELAVIGFLVAASGIAFTLIERPAERWLRPRLSGSTTTCAPVDGRLSTLPSLVHPRPEKAER